MELLLKSQGCLTSKIKLAQRTDLVMASSTQSVDMSCDHMTTLLLQSLEGLDPKTKLSGASQVTLSDVEVRALRRDMQEQENLIQGYQVIPRTTPADRAISLHSTAVHKTTPESAPQLFHCMTVNQLV